MKTKPVLGLTDVNLILDAAQKEADANGWPVTIAVADDGGHVLGLRRLDATAPFTAHVAMERPVAPPWVEKRHRFSKT